MSDSVGGLRLSLAWKFILAFAAVVLVGVGTVSILANQGTARELRGFMVRGGMTDASQLAQQLEGYYRGRGSWEGVELLLEAPSMGHQMRGAGRGEAMGSGAAVQPALYDVQGQWIAGSSSTVSPTLSTGDLANATPIQVEGEIVGYVIVEAVGGPNSTDELIDRVNRAIWLAALAAGAAALLIGGLLVIGLLRPVKALTSASKELSQGDLSQRVPVTTRDERGELSLAFNQMADNLEQMEAQRRDLTADIAHELRNPLSVMQARLEGIIDGVYEPSSERLKSVLEQSKLLNRLVEDLRMLALADAGQLTLDRADTDLSSLAAQAVEVYRTQAEEGDVRLGLDAPAPGSLVANVDPARMEQVLGNLLSNALRHTPPKGKVELAVARRDGVGSVLIEVSDTGEGIPEESLPFVFDRFYRADRSRSRERGGTGLGLAITRELVEAHGGSIEVSNRQGGGTVFSIELPSAE